MFCCDWLVSLERLEKFLKFSPDDELVVLRQILTYLHIWMTRNKDYFLRAASIGSPIGSPIGAPIGSRRSSLAENFHSQLVFWVTCEIEEERAALHEKNKHESSLLNVLEFFEFMLSDANFRDEEGGDEQEQSGVSQYEYNNRVFDSLKWTLVCANKY